jgi:hypothetical protein
MPVQLHGGDAFLGLGDQINTPKPRGKWQFRGFKDRPRRQRGLMPAAVALAQLPEGQLAVLVMTAAGAAEPLWPTPLGQRLAALRFGARPTFTVRGARCSCARPSQPWG